MDDTTLERAKELDADIEYFSSIVSDLKHINRGYYTKKDGGNEYSDNKGKWFTGIKKLFRWTDITIEKDKRGTRMYVDPHSIGGTTIGLNHRDIQNDDVHLQWAKARDVIFDTIIKETSKVRDVAQAEYDKL